MSTLPGPTRRRFLAQCATGGALLCTGSKSLFAAKRAPSLHFPSEPRERIAIASYPFRNFIAGKENKSSHPLRPIPGTSSNFARRLDKPRAQS
ncbi:MAG: hypothetical protein DMG46_19635 [Acidobacteria bacterium]|nr:MAG: hypothetical protein DMG46_19635 [Acidobacteriota bacterium]